MPSSTASVGRLRLAPTTTEHFAEPILMHATIVCTCTGASSIAASHGLPAWSSERSVWQLVKIVELGEVLSKEEEELFRFRGCDPRCIALHEYIF